MAARSTIEPCLSGLLERLTPEQSKVVSSKFHHKKFAKGSTIFWQTEAPNAVYFVELGRVKLTTNKNRDSEVTVSVAGEGDLFGMVDISCSERSQSATAMEDLVVWYITKDDMIEMMLLVPQFAVNVLECENASFLKLIDHVVSCFRNNSCRRLASALLRLADEGERTSEGVRLKSGVTHEFLASLIGCVRETVTLDLKELKKNGAVMQQGRRLIIHPELLPGG